MAELNTAVWGTGIEVNPFDGKLDENKVYYATTSERPTGGDDQDNKSQTYTLDRLEADGKIVCGQDFDLSPCYIMVDENCPWTKSVSYQFIREDGVNSAKRLDTGIINETKAVPVMIGTGYIRPGTNDNNVFNCSTSISTYTGDAQMPYFMLNGWKNNRRLTNERVMQYSPRKYKTLPSVNGANFQPFVKFGGKAIIARIFVEAKGDSGNYQTYSLYDYCYKGTTYTDKYKVLRVYYDARIIDSNNRSWVEKNGGAWSSTYTGNSITAVPFTSEYNFEVSSSVDCKASTWGTYLIDGRLPCLFGTYHTTISLSTQTTYFNSIDTHSSFEQGDRYPNVLTPITQNDLWGTADDFYEYFMRSAAYLGLFFTPYSSTDFPFTVTNQDEMFTDEKMYCGVIDENGITHGEYTHGEDNEDQIQFTSKDIQKDSGVKPGGGGGGRPDPDPNPVLPSVPGLNQLTGAGSVCYALSAGDFQQVWNDIYAKRGKTWEKLIEGLQLFGSNPLNAILAYRWYPFYITSDMTELPIFLGRSVVNRNHKYSLVGRAFYTEGGSFWYGREKNFINSKHCKCRMFLPFYGFVELPMSQVLSKELEIQFQYNMPDNLGVWIISFGDVIYDYYECAPYIDIPITGDNGAQIAAIEKQQALSTALTVGSIAAAVITGVSMAAPTIGNIATAAAETAAVSGSLSLGANISELAAEGLVKPALVAVGAGLATKGAASGVSNIVSSKTNAANQIGTLSTNVPTKAGAAATTFLHLPFTPYIQFYTNKDMETANITEYKKTVGIACEKWAKISEMPSDSLLAISNPTFNTGGMTQNEIAALINALNGFYK